MRIELKVYTTREQRERMKRFRKRLMLFCFKPLHGLLPLIEILAGAALAFLMCCTDSENLRLVVEGGAFSALLLSGSFLLDRYISAKLRSLMKEKKQRRGYPYRRGTAYLLTGNA